MSQGTSFHELYVALGAVITSSTGRDWWKDDHQKIAPKGTYAIVAFKLAEGVQNPVVENVELDTPVGAKTLQEIPWGTVYVDCEVDFYRNGSNDSAKEAAVRFKNSLYKRDRVFDLNEIMGISGNVNIVDIGAIFRADNESREKVKFSFYANISKPYPLDDNNIEDIDRQIVDIERIDEALESTEITADVSRP